MSKPLGADKVDVIASALMLGGRFYQNQAGFWICRDDQHWTGAWVFKRNAAQEFLTLRGVPADYFTPRRYPGGNIIDVGDPT